MMNMRPKITNTERLTFVFSHLRRYAEQIGAPDNAWPHGAIAAVMAIKNGWSGARGINDGRAVIKRMTEKQSER